MGLMREYGVTMLTWNGMRLEMPHKPAPVADVVRKALEEHTAPLPDEPWNAIPQDAVDQWAEGGKTT
jgi:hypothetical protein